MDSQTLRTALGTLQANPDEPDAWSSLTEALQNPADDQQIIEAVTLLDAARLRHVERGEWNAVARLLESAATILQGTTNEAAYVAEQARVSESELYDEDSAAVCRLRLLELDPSDTDATTRIEESQERRGTWEELAQRYASEAEGASDDVYRSAMLMRSAEAEVRYSAHPRYDVVADALERAVRLDPTNTLAAKLLEVVYRRQERWEEAARVLERAADRSDVPAERIAAGVRLARLYALKLGDDERAARAYDRVLVDAPNQQDALEYVTGFFSTHERWDALVRVYERPLEGANLDDPSRLGDMLQIAMLHWKKRGVLADAEPWFERIRKIEPNHDGMLAFFREYKHNLEDDAGLAQILQGAQRALAEDDPRRAELTQEIGSLAESQANAQQAVEHYKSMLRADPDNAEARESLKHLYKQTQGHNALVELLRQQLERTPESQYQERLAIMREIAGVYREYVKSDTALVSILNQIVQLDGKLDEGDVAEVRELVALYQRLGRWRDLLSSQQLLAELVSDVAEKKSLYREVARRWLDQFSNVQHAMEAYAALHALDPLDQEAMDRLEELYRKRRAWKELFSLYEEQLGVIEGMARVTVLREMAQLAAERLNRGTDAVRYYKEILDLDPTRVEILDRLERHAERSKDWATLADVLERRLLTLEDTESKLTVLQKLGPVYAEHVGDQVQAIGAWRRVLDLEPRQPRAMRVLRDTFLRNEDYDGLETLYTSQGDFDGLVEVLGNTADRSPDSAVKIDLSYRAARVYEENLGQPDRAFRAYERVLANAPADTRAATKLLPLYAADEKWARVPALYEILLAGTSDPAEKVGILESLVDVTGQKLSDRRAAAAHARRAYEVAPADPRAVELLEQTARAAGHWDEMVSALEARLAELGPLRASGEVRPSEPGEPEEGSSKRRGKGRKKKGASAPAAAPAPVSDGHDEERRLLGIRLATVYGEELGRIDEAVAKLKELASARPTDEAVSEQLEQLLRRTDRRDDLRWLFELRTTHAPNDSERTDVLNQWARLEEQVFGEPERARGIYARALELKPEDSEALASSVRLAVIQSDWAAAALNLERQRKLAAGEDRSKKELELAELYTDRLARPRDAFVALESALELGAEPGQVISIAQRLMDRDEVRAEVARLLSSQYEAQGDARQEALAVAALLRETSEPSESIALYHRLANVYEHKLGEPSGALDAVLQGLARHPTELELWDRADDLGLRTRRSTALAESYRSALRTQLSTEIERELATRAARVHEESLGDLLGAVPYYERLLALDPDDERAFTRLKEILTASERWGELEALYERAEQRIEDPIRKAEMLAELALIADEIIDDPEKAAGYYERIVTYDPVHAVGLETLDRLYVRLDRKKSLAGVLDRRIELAAGEQLNELRVRAGRLALELHDPQKSIALVEEVLGDQPNNYAARELCEQLIEVGNVRVRAARALESVYELRDEVRELVRVLGVRIESLRSPGEGRPGEATPTDAEREDERRELLRRVATLRSDRLHDDEGSFDAFAELAPLDPLDGDLRDRLVESGRRLGRHARVAEVLTATADAADSPQLKGEILMQVAGIQRDQLGDVAAAEASYRRVLTIDENDPDLVLPSARALEALFQTSGRSKELVDVLRLQVKLEPDSDRRNMLWARIGELSSEVLGDTAGAIGAWEARLEDNPDDPRALAALDDVYARADRYQDLVGVLERRRDLATGEGDRRRFLERQAQVQKDRLGAVSEAITSYQILLDEFGPESTVFEALEGLYRKTERWNDLNEIYERHIDVTETEATRLDVLAALGTLRRDQLGELSSALDAYRRALSLDSSHRPSRAALDEMLEVEDRGARSEAAEILRPIFESEGDHARLLHVVEIEAELADDPSEKVEKLELATRIAEDALGDVARACGYAERAVREAAAQGELRPHLETLDRLAALAQRRRAQAAVLEEIVPELFDGDLQIEVIRRVAELYRRELGDAERARELYKKAIELRSDDTASLVALEELYAEVDDSENLLDILQRRAEVAESDDERRDLAYRQAELLSGKLKQAARAVEVYESIIDLSLHARAVRALTELYSSAERWDDLVALLSRRIDDGDGNEADLRAELARIVSEHGGDVERALDELEQVLARDAQHAAAVGLLEKIQKTATEPGQRSRAAALLEPVYLVRADYDRVAATLRTRLESVETPDERRDLVTRLAQIHEEQKEDYLGALEISAQLLDEDLSDQGAVAELERLAKVAGAEKRLAEIYATALGKVDVDDEGSARLAQRAAELFEQAGDDGRALTQYKRALAFAPENERLFRSVDGILTRAADHEARVALYREALEHRFDPAQRVPLLHVIARLERDQLGRLASAIETYEEVVAADEHDATALEALTDLYAKTEKWENLGELYQRRAESSSAAEGAKYRLSLADLFDRRLEAPERAVDQLEEIVRDLPSHKEALTALEAYRSRPELRERVVELLRPLYENLDDWKRLIKLTEDRFALASESADKVAVLRETAELWETRGDDPSRARLVLGEALHLEPDEPAVRDDYERLTDLTGSHAELAETYEAILEEQPEVLSRRDYLAKLAEVYDSRLDDPRRALWAYSGLHELESGEIGPVESMEKLALLLSDWVVLARALEAKADLVFDEEERADAWRRIGEIRHQMLDDDEGALAAYERAFELDQTNAPTSDRLIELYEQKGDAARLVDLYQARVDLASEAEVDLKYQLLLRAATRFESDLRDRPRAIESLSRALGLRPGSAETLQDLNRLYRAEEMWPELLDNLRLEAGTEAEIGRRLELRREVARTLSDKLESHEEAIEAYRQVLEERPDDVASLDAVTALASEHEHLRGYATDVLIPVLRQTTLRERLVDALEMRLGTETEPSVRAETLRTIAGVQETDLGQPKAALETLLRALGERPDFLELHDAIERLAAQTSGWSSYVAALEERGAEAYDPYVAKELLVRAGMLSEERLGDPGRAIRAYARAAEQAGDQPDLLEALDRLYTAGGRTEDLLGVLDRRLSLEDSEQRQAELHYRVGRLKLDQKEPGEALGALRSALERDKSHTGASETLEKLLADDSLFEEAFQILEDVYRERGETDRLAGLYERRVAKAKSPAERIDMRRGLARVLEDDCRDPAAAQKVLQQGLSDDPTDTGLHDEIERLAPITGDWSGAAQALLSAASSAGKLPPEAGRELCVRAATWLRDKVGDRDAAEAAFARASALEPENDDVLAELEELQVGAGRERDLIATLERRARLALDDSRRLEMYQRAKELSDRVGDRALGESILRQVVEFDDGNLWALEGLTDARRAAGDYPATFELLQKRIELEASASQVRALRFDAAAIAQGPLADPKRATKLFEELFEDEPMDRTASAALRSCYEQSGQWNDLARLSERLIDMADDSAERNGLRVELARLKLSRLKDEAGAVELLQAVLEEDPAHTEAVVALSELFEKAGRNEELADLLEREVEAARQRGDVAAEVRLLGRLAVVFDQKLSDRDKAIEAYGQVLAREPNDRSALDALVRLRLAGNETAEAATLLERLVAGLSGSEAVTRGVELASLHRKLGAGEQAASALERALTVEPSNVEVRKALQAQHEANGSWDKVAALLVQDADAAATDKERVQLLCKAARLHSTKRGDHGAAADLLARASHLTPDDRELLLELCDEYSASGRGNDAVAVLERVVESFAGKRTKELADIHRRLATAYLSQDNREKALDELNKAFRIEPGNLHVLKQLGEVALETGDLKKAQQMFLALRLQKLEGDSPISKGEVLLRLGQVHQKLGEDAKAKQMYERALQADDKLEEAKKGLAELG